jgi:hypothetical protein
VRASSHAQAGFEPAARPSWAGSHQCFSCAKPLSATASVPTRVQYPA